MSYECILYVNDCIVVYTSTAQPVVAVDVGHINRTPGLVVGYGFKQFECRRCDFDKVIVLPRPRSELPGYVDPRWLAARRDANLAPVARELWARHRQLGTFGR